MSSPVVSVILPVHNRARLVQRAVRSVLEQRWADLELIVVDDGSSDATLEQLERIADDRLLIERLPIHKGAAFARNHGVGLAQGQWLAFQDSDDEWLPDKLERQLSVAEGADLVLCAYLARQVDQQLEVAPEATLRGGDPMTDLLDGWPIITPTWLVRREVILASGGFDESLACLEDWDLVLRLGAQLRISAASSKPLLIKNASADSVSGDPARLAPALAQVLARHAHCWAGESRRLTKRLTHLGCLQMQLGQVTAARGSLWRAARSHPTSIVPASLLLASFFSSAVFNYLERRWPTFTSMALLQGSR